MRLKFISFGYFILSLLLMAFGMRKSITGAVIKFGSSEEMSLISLSGFVFLCISLILFAAEKTLDAIIIPGQANERRVREKSVQAAKYYHEHGARVIIAIGGKTPLLDTKYKSEAKMICDTLIKEGVPKNKIILDEESKDNVGNIVNSLRHVHGHDIGIVSYPKHLDRFEYIIEKGKEEGAFDKNLRVHRIETNQSLAERLYEIPAGIITKRSLRKGVNSANPEGLMKKVANYLMKKFS